MVLKLPMLYKLALIARRTWSGRMNSLLKILKRLASERFYGTLTIKFEKGKVVIMNRAENIKPVDE